jgi:predicted ATPase
MAVGSFVANRNPAIHAFFCPQTLSQPGKRWTDPTSLEVLGRVVDMFPTPLIVTFRQEFDPPWIGRSHATALTINRLTRREVGAMMIDRVVGNELLPASIPRDIMEGTDGTPLFVEQWGP